VSALKRLKYGPEMRAPLAKQLHEIDSVLSHVSDAVDEVEKDGTTLTDAEGKRKERSRSRFCKSRSGSIQKCFVIARGTTPSSAPEPRRRSHRLLAQR
jgi:hypothetical protein